MNVPWTPLHAIQLKMTINKSESRYNIFFVNAMKECYVFANKDRTVFVWISTIWRLLMLIFQIMTCFYISDSECPAKFLSTGFFIGQDIRVISSTWGVRTAIIWYRITMAFTERHLIRKNDNRLHTLFNIPLSYLASACFGSFWSLLFQLFILHVWLRITDEGSVPEIRIWSISLIYSD